MADAIVARGLTKSYSTGMATKHHALKAASFSVAEGEVFGFLGLNGAGKTTTIKMLTTVMAPTSGTATVAGFDVVREPMKVRKVVGFMPESPGFYPDMAGEETLRYFARFYMDSAKAADVSAKLMDKVGLSQFRSAPTRTYSRGMRKRLALASALVNDPNVLIMDEPTSGLDPMGVNQFKLMIKGLARMGMTVFFSSHILSDVEEVADRVLILNKGEVVTVKTVDELRESFAAANAEKVLVRLQEPASPELVDAIRSLDGVDDAAADGARLTVTAKAGRRIAPEVNFALASRGARVLELKAESPALEQLFLKSLEGRQ